MTRFVAPMDAVWLWIESETSPTSVVVLQIFRPPAGSGPEFLDGLYRQITDPTSVKPGFRRRAYKSAATGGQFAWADDGRLDMAAHVRRATLPAPGRIRELLEFVGVLHGQLMTRERPQWEARLVDGLTDGRFALCTKLHHSMFDGVNMGRHLLSGLSADPSSTNCVAPWIIPNKPQAVQLEESDGDGGPVALVKQAFRSAGEVFGSLKTLAKTVPATVREREVPFAAPDSILNGRVGTSRRFAGDAWPIVRLKAVAKSTGASINDVGLAMCGGALRSYLLECDALPVSSLVAGVPVSLSGTDAGAASRDGNAIGAVLCNLGTDLDDPIERLRRVHASMANNKSMMAGLDPLTTTAVTSGNMAGFLLGAVSGLPKFPRPAFNLVVSNVPGLRKPLYWNGAEMTDFYPSSVVMNGQALNITLLSYKDDVAIGLTADPEVLPHMQRLLIHLENALVDLEKASA
ncbi:MAG TPA: wax ester/triacylglycerol synthase family O-acyltransferase [Pseudonocardia sp.]